MAKKAVAPEGETMARGEYKGKFGMFGDKDALPNQPGCFDMGICCHKGTTAHPAEPTMLDAGELSGMYQNPDCACCTKYTRPVPALGFLCMCDCMSGCPICCYIVPFNCCGFNKVCPCGALGAGGPPIDLLYCPTGKCLPKNCTLAATWFCLPSPCCLCVDFVDTSTMLTSCGCCCPQVWRKVKDYDVIIKRPTTGCCKEYDRAEEGYCNCC